MQELLEHGLLRPGAIVVAVSGGTDSTALLLLLADLSAVARAASAAAVRDDDDRGHSRRHRELDRSAGQRTAGVRRPGCDGTRAIRGGERRGSEDDRRNSGAQGHHSQCECAVTPWGSHIAQCSMDTGLNSSRCCG